MIGQFEKCIVAASQAIDLLEKLEPDQDTEVASFYLFCCESEAYARTLDHEFAFEGYADARDILNSLPDSTPNIGDLKNRIEDLESLLTGFLREEDGVTQSIGPGGGVLQLPDCIIYFNEGSVSSDVLIHAELDFPAASLPDGKILVTPVLRMIPNIKLGAPVLVRLTTWLASARSNEVKICYRETENSAWEEIQTTPTLHSGQNVIEFEIEKFCQYGCCVNKEDKVIYKMVPRLFYDPSRKLMTILAGPNCPTLLSDQKKEAIENGFKQVCSTTQLLNVCAKDRIQISVKDMVIPKSKEKLNYSTVELKVTDQLLETWRHDPLDFLLPHSATGIIDFTHVTEQLRDGTPLNEPLVHADRINLESSESTRNYEQIVAMNLVTNGGRMVNQVRDSASTINVGRGRRRRRAQRNKSTQKG